MAPRNRIIGLIIKVAVSSALLSFLVSKTGASLLLQTIRDVSLTSLVFSALLYVFSIFISSIRWSQLLMKGVDLKRLFSLYLIGSFFNNLMPGIIGGDAVKAYYLDKTLKEKNRISGDGSSQSTALSLASVFMDRYIGFVSLLIIALIAYPLGMGYFRGSYIEWILPVILVAFIIGSLILFILRLGGRIRFIAGFYEYLKYYKNERLMLFKCLLLSIFIQVVTICSAFVISRGIGLHTPFYYFAIIIPIISVISSLPVSISGLGVREASFVLLLSPIGVTHTESVTLSLTWFLSFVIGSLPGLIFYIRLKV